MLEIHNSKKTLQSFMEMDIFNANTKERVADADIILLPDFNVRDGVDRAFQPDTVTFYKYLLRCNDISYKVELFENKGEEKILSLHSFDIWLPTMFIGSSILLPFVINLVSNFVYDRMKGRPADEPTVHFNLMVENKEKGITKNLYYKGTIDGFKENFEKIDLNKMWED